jgi:hypothetical protein
MGLSGWEGGAGETGSRAEGLRLERGEGSYFAAFRAIDLQDRLLISVVGARGCIR